MMVLYLVFNFWSHIYKLWGSFMVSLVLFLCSFFLHWIPQYSEGCVYLVIALAFSIYLSPWASTTVSGGGAVPIRIHVKVFIIWDNRITSMNNWKVGWYTAFLMAKNSHGNNIIIHKMFSCLFFETTSSIPYIQVMG